MDIADRAIQVGGAREGQSKPKCHLHKYMHKCACIYELARALVLLA
jgi:hypothetical protein